MQENLSGAPSAPSRSWTQLVRYSAIAGAVMMILVSLLFGFFPPLVLFFVLFLVVAYLVDRPGRTGPILAVVTFTAFLLLNAPFMIPSLSVPASAFDFILGGWGLIVGAVGLFASVSVLRRSVSVGAPAALAKVALGLAGVLVVVGVIASATYDDAVARPGDIELVTEDIEFDKETIEAEAGKVSVFVDNKDTTFHTFTIDELGVDLDIPAGKAARVTFDVPESGSFVFYCVPHESDMEGVLEVN